MKDYSLKAIRVNLGLTLEEASKLIGISQYTLYNYEHGRTAPSIELSKKIAKVYNVEIDKIRFETKPRKKKLAVKNEK